MRPSFRTARRTAALLAGVGVLAAAPAAALADSSAGSACAGANDIPTATTLDQARTATLCLLNRERTSHGLRKLTANSRLRSAAQTHSTDMASRGYFDHTSPGGSTMVDRIKRIGYARAGKAWLIGENIAWGTGPLATPAKTVDGWMHSAGHRANILRAGFREIGIGITPAAPVGGTAASGGGATYTTDFGKLG
jgi:uncharacterized protein YkwD